MEKEWFKLYEYDDGSKGKKAKCGIEKGWENSENSSNSGKRLLKISLLSSRYNRFDCISHWFTE